MAASQILPGLSVKEELDWKLSIFLTYIFTIYLLSLVEMNILPGLLLVCVFLHFPLSTLRHSKWSVYRFKTLMEMDCMHQTVAFFLQNSFFVMNGKNESSIFGAAIAIVSSNITMEGKLSFISNSAVCGGAIDAHSSTISMKGDVMFQNNSASRIGGAIRIRSSNITMEGELSFISNSAVNAGVIDAKSSTISMKGDVMFQNNSASADGGAIVTHSSNIAMEGELSFISNSAEYAGAIDAYSSTISMKGDVMFQNNSVSVYGGAISTQSSNIRYGRRTEFHQ